MPTFNATSSTTRQAPEPPTRGSMAAITPTLLLNWKHATTRKSTMPTKAAGTRPARRRTSPHGVSSSVAPSRADSAVKATIKPQETATTQPSWCPNSAPTREAVRMLPGPRTTEATISAGPRERALRGGTEGSTKGQQDTFV